MKCADLAPRDRELTHVEELDLRERASVRLLQDVERGGALDLEPVQLAPPGGIDGGSLVPGDRHVVVAGLRVVLHPVVGRGTTDESDLVVVQEEEDPVADHVSVVVAGDELLGPVGLGVRERVDAEVGEQPDDVGAFDLKVGHVMRLVEERARLHPGDLLVAPVRELGGHCRVDVGTDLRVARHLDRAPGRLQLLLQVLVAHVPRLLDAARNVSLTPCELLSRS